MTRRICWLLGPFIGLASLIGLVSTRWHPDNRAPVPPKADTFKEIHVEILNGCGTDGIARRVGHHLRSLGFDVMTLENAESFNYPESIVIDRVGKPDYAQKVAEALGIKNRIQQIIPDPFRIEEVTVIIGRDHIRLSLPPPR